MGICSLHWAMPFAHQRTIQYLASFVIDWDENGFRVPAMTADTYPIAVFGDSYTEGFNVARPWADGLANNLDVPVYNYGYRGYGPQEVATTATEFANAEPRQLGAVRIFLWQ